MHTQYTVFENRSGCQPNLGWFSRWKLSKETTANIAKAMLVRFSAGLVLKDSELLHIMISGWAWIISDVAAPRSREHVEFLQLQGIFDILWPS